MPPPEPPAAPAPAPADPRARRNRIAQFAGRRRAPDPAALARRHLLVAILKRGLPLLAFAALGLVALWPQIAGIEEGVRVAYRKPSISGAAGVASVIEPRFQGSDERGRPYTVSAESALQKQGSEEVALDKPRGDLELEGGAWVMLQADRGLFRRDSRMLDLSGDVTLFHDSGYEIRTDAAEIDLRAGSAHGERPVAAQGPAGTLDAAGFSLRDRGEVVVFGGPARMVLTPAAGAAP